MDQVVICRFRVTQISEVVMVRKTEIEDKEEEVVAVHLGKFEKIYVPKEELEISLKRWCVIASKYFTLVSTEWELSVPVLRIKNATDIV